MRHRLVSVGTISLAAVLIVTLNACTDTEGGPPLSDAGFGDGISQCTDPSGDWDQDGILDGEEGCVAARDSDNDGTPDWQDFDSDDDGLSDELESGKKDDNGKCAGAKPPNDGWPCDTDGDGYPDYLDIDADGDGLDDKDEDTNGDGLLGCCLTECGKPHEKQKDCILTRVGDKIDGEPVKAGEEGCGSGQICKAGKCTPAIGFGCSNGETNPLLKDTFGDGKLDGERGTFICRDASEDKPQGRKPIATHKNQDGDWHIAIEKSAKYGEMKIQNPGPKERAAAINEEDPATEVAGFVISRETKTNKIQEELTAILQSIQNKTPGGSGTVTVRASGIQGKSHDRYDAIRGTILDVSLSSPSTCRRSATS